VTGNGEELFDLDLVVVLSALSALACALLVLLFSNVTVWVHSFILYGGEGYITSRMYITAVHDRNEVDAAVRRREWKSDP
jgi:hypothetical protein